MPTEKYCGKKTTASPGSSLQKARIRFCTTTSSQIPALGKSGLRDESDPRGQTSSQAYIVHRGWGSVKAGDGPISGHNWGKKLLGRTRKEVNAGGPGALRPLKPWRLEINTRKIGSRNADDGFHHLILNRFERTQPRLRIETDR